MPEYDDIDTGHDYDGIREYDNRLPLWWLITLWGAVAFGMIYWYVYQTVPSSTTAMADYRAAMAAEASERQESQDNGSLLAAAQDPSQVKAGRKVFVQYCTSCHAKQAEGLVGPNLTDAYWKKGGSPSDIWVTIARGVSGTPMVSWRPMLGSKRLKQVVAYILSIRNTNVPGKAPEGVEYMDEK